MLALHPYAGWTLDTVPAPALGINTSLPTALADATTFLRTTAPSDAVESALRVLAPLESEPLLGSTQAAVDQLAAMSSPHDGSFEDSAYATALAARALSRASEFDPTAFDTDGDGIADLDLDGIGDVADLDDDGDGVLDSLEVGYASTALESKDSDGDGIPDNADFDDDQDGVTDIEERLRGLDPNHRDTDRDSFSDEAEILANSNGLDPNDYPLPDGDIHPLGAPDGIVDIRDALLALRIAAGQVTVSSNSQLFFERHANVAPLTGGVPEPDATVDAADTLVILRRVTGEIPSW